MSTKTSGTVGRVGRVPLVLLVAAFAFTLPSGVAWAESAPDADEPLRVALRGTCSAPDADQMLALHPDAPARLYALATSDAEDEYVRLRAVSLLSFFPGDDTEAWLDILMEVGPVRQRALAVYTFARTFGDLAPELVLARIEPFLTAAEDRIRTKALRGLAWVPGQAASRRLQLLKDRSADPATRALVTHVLQSRTLR